MTRTSVVTVPTEGITDWDSFHIVFAETLGFPEFCGHDMNAWIDCLTCADDAASEMLGVAVAPGELLVLRIDGAESFAKRCPEQYREMVECAAFVNYRRIEQGEPPVLALLLSGYFSP